MSWPTAKRTTDVVLAAIGLVVLAPGLLVVAAAVAIALGRPVLFRQIRAGRGGEPFEVLKFRSMLEPDPLQGIHSDADRLTAFGRFLRSTSLDELPSLWNVLRGDMSIVGPRPLPVAYLPRYSAEQARRHEVRPGITGLAQVCGRNSLSWEAKFALDVEYVEDTSFALDLRILCATVGVVLRRDGISAAGEVTAAEFQGTRVVADV
jgi:lipopolysaccharide/colanic/teichoic acid biosynthesis glycosyltransferase